RLLLAGDVTGHAAAGVLGGLATEGVDQFGGCRGLGVIASGGFLAVGVWLSWAAAGLASPHLVLLGREGGRVGPAELLIFGLVTGAAAFGSGVVLPTSNPRSGDRSRTDR